jgi:hypothetical protein
MDEPPGHNVDTKECILSSVILISVKATNIKYGDAG